MAKSDKDKKREKRQKEWEETEKSFQSHFKKAPHVKRLFRARGYNLPFYDFYEAAPRLWVLSPAQDQNFGGILMNAEQAAVFLAAILYYVLKLIPEEEHSSSRA